MALGPGHQASAGAEEQAGVILDPKLKVVLITGLFFVGAVISDTIYYAKVVVPKLRKKLAAAVKRREHAEFNAIVQSGGSSILQDQVAAGMPALHLAIVIGDCDGVSALLQAGAAVHVSDAHGLTAISYAVWMNDRRMLHVLMQRWQDTAMQNSLITSPHQLQHLQDLQLAGWPVVVGSVPVPGSQPESEEQEGDEGQGVDSAELPAYLSIHQGDADYVVVTEVTAEALSWKQSRGIAAAALVVRMRNVRRMLLPFGLAVATYFALVHSGWPNVGPSSVDLNCMTTVIKEQLSLIIYTIYVRVYYALFGDV